MLRTPSRTFRVCFLPSMLVSMAVVILWAGVIGWREWPRWRAVREMRAAVEETEPGRFLNAVEAVHKLGVCEQAADEIAALRHYPAPRVRMYAVMARTVLGPRSPAEAQQLIELFDDPEEDIKLRCTGAFCLSLFGEQARDAVPSLREAFIAVHDPRERAAYVALSYLPDSISGYYRKDVDEFRSRSERGRLLDGTMTRREMAEILAMEADNSRYETWRCGDF